LLSARLTSKIGAAIGKLLVFILVWRAWLNKICYDVGMIDVFRVVDA